MENKLVSVVSPFYNEEDGVEAFFSRIVTIFDKDLDNYNLEIIAINDGSTDQTYDRLVDMQARYKGVCVVDLSRNFGKEAALSAGLDNANGDLVVVIDSDLQHPPEKIPEMVRLWEEGHEVVLAKRANRDTDTRIQKITANAFYKFHNLISDIEVPSGVGDFRLMDAIVVAEVNKLKESHRFMKGVFAWVGFRSVTIEYNVENRASGETSFNTWKLWNFALEGITSYSTIPLRAWSYLGLTISLLSIMYALFLVFKTLVFGVDTPGFASIMVTILFIGGIQLIGIGVLGEYLGRTYSEVKNRPVYIARKIIK
ncbi:glycosyltransferase family 2 protein [Vibrio sp. 10N.222.54.F12]|uniref:glycosyltransferase family 2 protein n=1 Tax=Vibrio TaxID=662 RepID=UPI001F519EAD|nr:glycosyltransferase family 2 protein [Vibrio tasmaniensis]